MHHTTLDELICKESNRYSTEYGFIQLRRLHIFATYLKYLSLDEVLFLIYVRIKYCSPNIAALKKNYFRLVYQIHQTCLKN